MSTHRWTLPKLKGGEKRQVEHWHDIVGPHGRAVVNRGRGGVGEVVYVPHEVADEMIRLAEENARLREIESRLTDFQRQIVAGIAAYTPRDLDSPYLAGTRAGLVLARNTLQSLTPLAWSCRDGDPQGPQEAVLDPQPDEQLDVEP